LPGGELAAEVDCYVNVDPRWGLARLLARGYSAELTGGCRAPAQSRPVHG
jgi:hypothetical protein